jgi:hypothetical protein
VGYTQRKPPASLGDKWRVLGDLRPHSHLRFRGRTAKTTPTETVERRLKRFEIATGSPRVSIVEPEILARSPLLGYNKPSTNYLLLSITSSTVAGATRVESFTQNRLPPCHLKTTNRPAPLSSSCLPTYHPKETRATASSVSSPSVASFQL